MRRNHTESPWTDERITLLRSLNLVGKSASQMAHDINVTLPGGSISRNAVIGKLARLGLRVKGGSLPPRPKRRSVSVCMSGMPRPARAKPPPERAPLGPPIPFSDRRRGQCAFIFGDPKDNPLCCGHPTSPGSSYCSDHSAIVRPKFIQARAAA